jgi:hypothetical protein
VAHAAAQAWLRLRVGDASRVGSTSEDTVGGVGIALAGAASGALVGAVIGLAIPSWRTVYKTGFSAR